MEERLKQFMLGSKQLLLQHPDYMLAKKISTVCQLFPCDAYYSDFFLNMSCGILKNTSDPTVDKVIQLYQDCFPITVTEFKDFLINCSKQSGISFEIIIPDSAFGFFFDFYDYSDKHSLKKALEIIDESNNENDWEWPLAGGIGIRFVENIERI